MTKSEISRKFAALRRAESKLGDRFIAAGRGNEKPSEYLAKTDALAMQARALSARHAVLAYEAAATWGPDWIYRI